MINRQHSLHIVINAWLTISVVHHNMVLGLSQPYIGGFGSIPPVNDNTFPFSRNHPLFLLVEGMYAFFCLVHLVDNRALFCVLIAHKCSQHMICPPPPSNISKIWNLFIQGSETQSMCLPPWNEIKLLPESVYFEKGLCNFFKGPIQQIKIVVKITPS